MLPKSIRAAVRPLGAAAKPLGAAAAAALLATLLFTAGARADGPGGSGSGRRHGPPPPEALAACEKKAAGAACSFSHEGHDRTGVCWAPEDRPLACKPERPQPAP